MHFGGWKNLQYIFTKKGKEVGGIIGNSKIHLFGGAGAWQSLRTKLEKFKHVLPDLPSGSSLNYNKSESLPASSSLWKKWAAAGVSIWHNLSLIFPPMNLCIPPRSGSTSTPARTTPPHFISSIIERISRKTCCFNLNSVHVQCRCQIFFFRFQPYILLVIMVIMVIIIISEKTAIWDGCSTLVLQPISGWTGWVSLGASRYRAPYVKICWADFGVVCCVPPSATQRFMSSTRPW